MGGGGGREGGLILLDDFLGILTALLILFRLLITKNLGDAHYNYYQCGPHRGCQM